MTGVDLLLLAAGLYLPRGFLFGLAFVTAGVTRVDPAARGTSPAFRLVILPGSVALWPILLTKWVRTAKVEP